MTDLDELGADLPTDDMVQNWNEANAHADDDDWPQEDPGDVDELDPRALAATLRATVADLNTHIREQAAQAAAPTIARAEQRAAAAEQRAAQAEADYEQRLEDLRAELVRQVKAESRRSDRLLWLCQHLPELLRPLAGPIPPWLEGRLDPEFRNKVARLASPSYSPEAEAELRLLTDTITMVVTTQSAARLQTRMHVSYQTLQRLLQRMEDLGVVGPGRGRQARQVLLTRDQLPALLATVTAPGGESAP